jgi:hypothetical protein
LSLALSSIINALFLKTDQGITSFVKVI